MGGIIKEFDKIANYYDDWYYHPQGNQVFEAELQLVSRLIPSKGLGLEIGSGTGIFAERLSNESRIIICLEPSSEMLRKSKSRGCLSLMGVGGFLPFRNRIIRFTYLITVIEFIQEPKKILTQVMNVAELNAPLILLFINSKSRWGNFYKDLGKKGDSIFKHAKLYNLKEISGIFKEVGYKILEKLGTLTTRPEEPIVGGSIIEPGSCTGVIVIRAVPNHF